MFLIIWTFFLFCFVLLILALANCVYTYTITSNPLVQRTNVLDGARDIRCLFFFSLIRIRLLSFIINVFNCSSYNFNLRLFHNLPHSSSSYSRMIHFYLFFYLFLSCSQFQLDTIFVFIYLLKEQKKGKKRYTTTLKPSHNMGDVSMHVFRFSFKIWVFFSLVRRAWINDTHIYIEMYTQHIHIYVKKEKWKKI